MRTHFCYDDNPWKRGLKYAGIFILGGIAAVGFAILFGYFVMLLWNWLMPEIFGLVTITFWQAAGIIILARLIFGALKHHNNHHCNYPRNKFNSRCKDRDWWKNHKSNWRYFDDYWSEEGEESFNNYIERKTTNQGSEVKE